jgi:alkanesulfonate monooxygenase SsuD/methylene tetrahydromethanopterin reductase-like flavin-dependent oxidoreductase (luciferase family)
MSTDASGCGAGWRVASARNHGHATADEVGHERRQAVEAARSRTEVILGLVRREKPTLRRLLASLAGARGHFTFAGTPEQVADLIEDWFTDGAADGFNIMPPLLPAMLDVFSAEVIPLLQRRGLFRTAYEGKTLREHYGLAWPKSAFKEAALQEA